jgi:hypothetical protein
MKQPASLDPNCPDSRAAAGLGRAHATPLPEMLQINKRLIPQIRDTPQPDKPSRQVRATTILRRNYQLQTEYLKGD